MLRTNWYNYIRKSFTDYGVCQNCLLGAKGAKISVGSKKGSQRGPKSENLLYLSMYDSIRPKNWQMLRTNWYNCFRKVLLAIEFVKIGYWAPKAQK